MSYGYTSQASTPETYASIATKIQNPRRRKQGPCRIANNTYAGFVAREHESQFVDAIGVTLHRTSIIYLYPDGLAECRTGYQSLLTRSRMNAYLPDGWRVWSSSGVTYVEGPDGFLMQMLPGVLVGWDTSEVKEHLRALRLHGENTREAKHARAELELYYTRRGWTTMVEHIRCFFGIPRRAQFDASQAVRAERRREALEAAE